MNDYITAEMTARKWKISRRRISVLCAEGRVQGARRLGNMWLVPSTAVKPADERRRRSWGKSTGVAKPFLKWAGGKGQLLDEIAKYYPFGANSQIVKYAEPFVGGGAVMFDVLNKFELEAVYISDINRELINTYVQIRDHVEELSGLLRKMQEWFWPLDGDGRKFLYLKNRERFNELKHSDGGELERAGLLIFLNKTCFNGLYRVNRAGDFNVPMGAYKFPLICDEENLRTVAAKLQNVQIVCGDYTQAADFIDEKTFVYLDPPYRPLTKTANFTAYTEELFGDDKQLMLAEFVQMINNKGARLALSNSDPKNTDKDDNFFDEIYKNQKIHRVEATRAINRNAKARGKISELLITNF